MLKDNPEALASQRRPLAVAKRREERRRARFRRRPGRSSAPMRCSKVLLPQPDSPVSAMLRARLQPQVDALENFERPLRRRIGFSYTRDPQ